MADVDKKYEPEDDKKFKPEAVENYAIDVTHLPTGAVYKGVPRCMTESEAKNELYQVRAHISNGVCIKTHLGTLYLPAELAKNCVFKLYTVV